LVSRNSNTPRITRDTKKKPLDVTNTKGEFFGRGVAKLSADEAANDTADETGGAETGSVETGGTETGGVRRYGKGGVFETETGVIGAIGATDGKGGATDGSEITFGGGTDTTIGDFAAGIEENRSRFIFASNVRSSGQSPIRSSSDEPSFRTFVLSVTRSNL
jgi:hypothetical protein